MPISSDNLRQVARFLIQGPRPFTISRIPETINRPPASVYRIIRWLQYHRALLLHEGNWVPDIHRLLELVASTRRIDVVPSRTMSTSLDESGVHRTLTGEGIRYAMGYLTAANLHFFYQPERRIQVLVDPDRLTQARGALPDGDRPVEFFARTLGITGRQTMQGELVATDLLETAIDVRAHPDGGAHADLLLQALNRPRRGGTSNA